MFFLFYTNETEIKADDLQQQNEIRSNRKTTLSLSDNGDGAGATLSAVTPKLKDRDVKSKKDTSTTPKSLPLKSPKDSRKRADSVEKDDSKEEENNEVDASQNINAEMTPRHKMRAAAAVAKSKLSTRGAANDQDATKIERPVSSENLQAQGDRSEEFASLEKPKSSRKSSGSGSGSASKRRNATTVTQAVIEDKYVCCEKCEKWRRIPSHVNENELPDKWLCSMNIWDPLRNSCDTPEENFAETAATAVVEPGSSKITGEETLMEDYNPAISEPVEVTKKIKLKKKRSTDEGDLHENDYDGAVLLEKESAKKKTRKSISADPVTPRGDDRLATPAAASDQWVQCDKCSKWRRVPVDVDVDQLPKVWYCHMNTWALQYAKCGVVQEKTTKRASQISTEIADDAAPRTKLNRRSDSISASATEPAQSAGVSGAPAPAPVTKWIQCDRKNCQKWRKVAAYVDMDTMPDTW